THQVLSLLRLEEVAVHLGFDVAGGDGIHANVVPSELDGKRAGELYDATFRSRVGRECLRGTHAQNRGDVDDRALLVRGDKPLNRFLRSKPDAVQVDGQERAPVLIRHFQRRFRAGKTRVV